MEEIRKNVLSIEDIKKEISQIELLEQGEGDNISYEIENRDTIKGLFEDNYETISEAISKECKDGKKISEFFNDFFEEDDVYASVKALLLDRLFNEVAESKTQPQQEPLNAPAEGAKEQATEEKSEQEENTSAQVQQLQKQNELADAEKPAEQLQFDPNQIALLENRQISLMNSCLNELNQEVRTLRDENEELLIKNNNQLVVFKLIYNEQQDRMLRLQQAIQGLEKCHETYNVEKNEHIQFVDKIKNNYGFGFIQPKNAIQYETMQDQFARSDDEKTKIKERRELALTTYKALVDLNKETNRGLLQ